MSHHIFRNIYKMLTPPRVYEDVVWKRKWEVHYNVTLASPHAQFMTTALLTRKKWRSCSAEIRSDVYSQQWNDWFKFQY